MNIEEKIIRDRRYLHQNPELGFELDKTLEYLKNQLGEIGIEAQLVGRAGLSFTLGKEGPVILLRGDMDALPIREETDLDFKSTNNNMHACGHDCHTAMLLGAARILKKEEARLKGRIKFMFQPAEELLAGAQDMIENGILDNPKVDMALGLHLSVGNQESKTGRILYKRGYSNYSGDAVKITVLGKDAHGSRPDLGIDAIQIASHIAINLNGLVGREITPGEASVVLVGKIYGGTTVNTVADRVVMEVSLRSMTRDGRARLLKRVRELAEKTADSFGGRIIFEHSYGMPSLYNHDLVLDQAIESCSQLLGEENVLESKIKSGSEDFSIIAERVPSAMLHLGAGSLDEGYQHSMHESKMRINEDALIIGARVYASCALDMIDRYNRK